MRYTLLLGMSVLCAACSTKEAPPADTAAVTPSLPPGRALGSVAGIWDVSVKPLDSDSILITYILNNTDTTGWLFAFPEEPPVKMRVTDRSGDTLVAEAGPFESKVRPGLKTRTVSRAAFVGSTMTGTVVARYETTGPDSVRTYRIEGARR
jgi:hypothetical protein